MYQLKDPIVRRQEIIGEISKRHSDLRESLHDPERAHILEDEIKDLLVTGVMEFPEEDWGPIARVISYMKDYDFPRWYA